ncbi:MAG TPA: hypothetical protein VFA48_05405 [Gammaproteobacteria bacterium]|nr:hypothetical protein [Gammaproteobacteria bacterium]
MFAVPADWFWLDDALLALWLPLLLLQPDSAIAARTSTITVRAPSMRFNMMLSS